MTSSNTEHQTPTKLTWWPQRASNPCFSHDHVFAKKVRNKNKVAAWAIDLLDVHPSDRILEVGFGPGVGIQLLAETSSALDHVDLLPASGSEK